MAITVFREVQTALDYIASGPGVAVALNVDEFALLPGGNGVGSDQVLVGYTLNDDVLQKEATTYMGAKAPADTSGGLENYNGPLVHYLWRYRSGQPAIELDFFVNNGNLDNEFVDPPDSGTNPLYPNKNQDYLYITAPAGYGWVTKTPHQEVTEATDVGENIYKINLFGVKPYQGSLIYCGLYLVPKKYLIDGKAEGTPVDDYIKNLTFLEDTSAVSTWWPVDIDATLSSPSTWTLFSKPAFDANHQFYFDEWLAQQNSTAVAAKMPPGTKYVAFPNGQATGGDGMNQQSAGAGYDLALSNSDSYKFALSMLMFTLHRPTMGFFNHYGAPTQMQTIGNDIATKTLFNESNEPGWNMSLAGNYNLFSPNGNPYGVSGDSIPGLMPNFGFGTYGYIDAQHFGRAYGWALYLAQRFDDPVGKMAVRWFASCMRLDQESTSGYIGYDAEGPWSNLARDAAFAAYINAADWYYNKNVAAKTFCEEFITTCESYQTSSWTALGGDGSHSGGLNAQRGGGGTTASKEVNLAKHAYLWNTGGTDDNTTSGWVETAEALTTSSVSQTYQDMLLYQALFACSAAGLTVADATFSGLGNFIVDCIGPNQTTPWYRVCPSASVFADTVSGVKSITPYTTAQGVTINAVSGGWFVFQGGVDDPGKADGLTKMPGGNEYNNAGSYFENFLGLLMNTPSTCISDATKLKAMNSYKYGGGNTSNPVNGATYTFQEMANGDNGGGDHRDPFFEHILGYSQNHTFLNNNSNVEKEIDRIALRSISEKPNFPY